MTLIDKRVTEMFPMFGQILNLTDDTMIDLGSGIKLPVNMLVPILMPELAKITNEHSEKAEGIFNWISDAILYMKGDIDDLPLMDFGVNITLGLRDEKGNLIDTRE